jgi:hypothetical protein
MPVLVMYQMTLRCVFTGLESTERGSKMIHVARSADMVPEFEAFMAGERRRYRLEGKRQLIAWEPKLFRPYCYPRMF